MSQNPNFFSPKLIQLISIFNPKHQNFFQKLQFNQLISHITTKSPMPISQFFHSLSCPINPNPNFKIEDFNTLCKALKNPNLLDGVQIDPSPSLLLTLLKRFDASPKEAFSLFKWAERRPGYDHTNPVFNSMVNIISKCGEFKWALMVLLNEVKKCDGCELVTADSLGILIRNCARLGNVFGAVHVCDFGKVLGFDMFDVMLDGLCKYGHVRLACDCVERRKSSDRSWFVSVDVYNAVLEGWFRVRNLEEVERLLWRMKREELVLGVGTYGVLVEGYCRMGLVDRAIELLGEMRRDGVGPNRRVYDSLVDALAQAGRFKEALGMLERFLVLELGPTLTTYNALVRGFCKAGDVDGAGKVLKMMTSRGVVPTSMTYNHFFRYFSKHGKVEEGVGLYRKMIEAGYELDGKTCYLMLNMSFEEERLDLVMQIREDMRCRGHVLDLDMSTMLINLFCKRCKFEEAVMEFEELIQRGLVPMYNIYQILHSELQKKGLNEMASRVSSKVAAISCSKPLPSAFGGIGETSRQRRKFILEKAEAMSDNLKTWTDPREMPKVRRSL